MREAYAQLFAELPPPETACMLSIAIPVCNESEKIEACLRAFTRQVELSGRPVAFAGFEVLVFANNCIDDTVRRIQWFRDRHPYLQLHLVDTARLEAHSGNIATARRAVMDAAARRMAERQGLIATTDGDTVAGNAWIAQTRYELRHRHAVGGRVIPVLDSQMPRAFSQGCALQLEHRYRYALVRLEALIDPLEHDPWPRHGNHQGASLALRAGVYQAVGGIPDCTTREDFALYQALVRHDFRFRHSLRVRVATSARRIGRAANGFAADLSELDAHVRGEKIMTVEHPRTRRTLFEGRAALRRGDLGDAARLWQIPASVLRRLSAVSSRFGAFCEEAEYLARTDGALSHIDRIPLHAALELLELYARGYSPSRADRVLRDASAAEPTRSIA